MRYKSKASPVGGVGKCIKLTAGQVWPNYARSLNNAVALSTLSARDKLATVAATTITARTNYL